MNTLINIKEENGKQVVSARELHYFLESKAKFTDWCERMFEYGFSENKDYVLVSQKCETNNPKNPFTTLIDYALTLDTAKEISMIQRSEKGKQARQYFIDCEKVVKGIVPPSPQDEMQVILNGYKTLMHKVESQQEEIARKTKEIKELAPAANYANEVLNSENNWTTTTIASELGMSAQRLNKLLYEMRVQYKNSDQVWVLYEKYKDKGYTKTRTTVYHHTDGTPQTAITTTWTEEGRRFIHGLIKKDIAA